MLDVFQTESADMLAQAARQPAAKLETTPADAFYSAWQANDRFNGVLAWQRNMADAAQDHLDMFAAKTGERLANPYRLPWNPLGWDLSEALDRLADVRKRTAAKSTELNDPSLAFPGEESLYGQGIQKARAALDVERRASEGQQTFGTGLAHLAAGAVSQFDDPINAGLNAIAIGVAPGASSVLRGALMTGATFGAQSAAEEAMTYGYKSVVLPGHGIGDAAQSVIGSALGGVALDAGGRVLAGAFRKVISRNIALADALPQPVRDAAAVAERAADLDAQNPFKGVSGAAAYNEALAKIEQDLLQGRSPELPAAALDEASARTGQVFASREPSQLEIVDRHAQAADPDLFDRVGRADADIAAARAALEQLHAQMQPADDGSAFGALSHRIADLQGQLDQITGKRRSSPRAQALRDQIEELRARNDRLDADAAARDANRSALLRQRLVEAQNDRARLGPEVRAAREAAAAGLEIPLDFSGSLDAAPSHSGNRFVRPEAPEPVPARTKRAGSKKTDQQSQDETQPSREIERADGNVYAARRSVAVKYELAERADLVTSHDQNFVANPAYPAELQPRNRAGAPQREQVYDMAAKLEPERLGPSPEANSGAPIVGPDNVVESGNGRTMAIGMAYARGDGAYRAWLERRGFDTSGFNEPVLVARRTEAMSAEERAAFAHTANGSASLRMSATEQALSDARHIGADLAAIVHAGDIRSGVNRDFVRSFVDRLPPGERGGLMTASGHLSQAGANRIRAALVARAFGDPEVVARAFDHAEPNIKTIAAALTEAAPEWIKMRDAVTAGEIPAGVDITDPVMTAVRSIMRARDEARPLGEIMTQGDFFTSDMSQLAARLFFKDGSFRRFLSKADMGDNLTTFARELLKTRGAGENLFGEAPPATGDILSAAVRRSDARVASMMEAARKPENVAKAFDDPKVQEAAQADLQRQIEQGRNRVPVENKDGGVSLGFADKELHDLGAQIALADEVRACSALGKVAAE